MPGSAIITKQESARLIFSSNVSLSNFTDKVPTATAPTPAAQGEGSNGIFDFGQDANIIECGFFGQAAGTQFDVRIYGWRICSDSHLWIPYLLAQLRLTTSNVLSCEAAVRGSVPTASDYIVDTIVVQTGAPSSSLIEPGAADDLMASYRFDGYGMNRIEFEIDTLSSTNANGWVSTL